MNSSTATQAINKSSLYNSGAGVTLGDQSGVGREETRYLFSIGDHIEPRDRFGLDAPFGGLWIGGSETEGAPTLWRSKYMLHACAICSVETVAVPKKATHKEVEPRDENYLTGPGVPPGVRAYKSYAGDGVGFLQSDRFRGMGVVELTPLAKIKWETGVAMELQRMIFPWNEWEARPKTFPKTLRERVSFLDSYEANDSSIARAVSEMQESARLFRSYAMNHIEKNRQLIYSMRSVNLGGFTFGWNERSKLYASQIETSLEREDDLRGVNEGAQTAESLAFLKSQVETNQMLASILSRLLPEEQKKELGLNLDKAQPYTVSESELIHDVEVFDETPDTSLMEQEATPIEAELDVVELHPAFDGICHGTRKKTGERCKNAVEEGQLYCDVHKK